VSVTVDTAAEVLVVEAARVVDDHHVRVQAGRARRTNPGGETPTFGPGARRWMAMQTPANSSPSPSTIGPTETTWFNRAPTRRLTSGASRREK
jgi:hypothetical protein